jgi:hypothetical protein
VFFSQDSFFTRQIGNPFFSIQYALYSLKSYFFKSKFGENSPVKENPDKAHYSQTNLKSFVYVAIIFSGQNLAKTCHQKKP